MSIEFKIKIDGKKKLKKIKFAKIRKFNFPKKLLLIEEDSNGRLTLTYSTSLIQNILNVEGVEITTKKPRKNYASKTKKRIRKQQAVPRTTN